MSALVAKASDDNSSETATNLSSIYLSNSVDTISKIDFESDSKQDIANKITRAQLLLEHAKRNLKLKQVSFTEIVE